MVCKCTHRMLKHQNLSGKCSECDCESYDQDIDFEFNEKPWWIDSAILALKMQLDTVEDLLYNYKKGTIIAHGKESKMETGHGDRYGLDIAVLVAEEDFDIEQWRERRMLGISMGNRIAYLETELAKWKKTAKKLKKKLKGSGRK